jgi:RNA polymerase sigma factor (TIGR02999 family)
MSEVTRILERIGQSDPQAADELLPLVCEELRKLAAARMAGQRAGHTLQPTALVHEAWLRLAGADAEFEGRTHFFAAAAEAMRHILVDHARRKSALRHGGGQQRVEFDEAGLAAPSSDDQILAVNDALEKRVFSLRSG